MMAKDVVALMKIVWSWLLWCFSWQARTEEKEKEKWKEYGEALSFTMCDESTEVGDLEEDGVAKILRFMILRELLSRTQRIILSCPYRNYEFSLNWSVRLARAGRFVFYYEAINLHRELDVMASQELPIIDVHWYKRELHKFNLEQEEFEGSVQRLPHLPNAGAGCVVSVDREKISTRGYWKDASPHVLAANMATYRMKQVLHTSQEGHHKVLVFLP